MSRYKELNGFKFRNGEYGRVVILFVIFLKYFSIDSDVCMLDLIYILGVVG